MLSAPLVEQPLQARGNNPRGVASVATPAFTEQPSIVAEAIIWPFAKRACSSFHQRASYSFLTIWQKAGVPTSLRASFASLVALLTWRDLLFCAKHLLVAAIGGRVRVTCAAFSVRDVNDRPRGTTPV
jgi:hypothetical protein